MYNEIVKRLLEKHFGEAAMSLDVMQPTRKSANRYYYTKTLEQYDEIKGLVALLEMKHLVNGVTEIPELLQELPQDEINGPRCMCYSEHDGHWTLHLYAIKSVRYHRTYRARTTATLVLNRYPIVTLSDSNPLELFGLCHQEPFRKQSAYLLTSGFSYWHNRELMRNPRYKSFVAELLGEVADVSKKYILKDIARAIAAHGCFLPRFSGADLHGFHTPADMIRAVCPEAAQYSIDFNKIGLNTGYIFSKIARFVDERDYPFFLALDDRTLKMSLTLQTVFDGVNADDYIPELYAARFHYGFFPLADDYVGQCIALGECVRISLNERELTREHDRVSALVRKKANEKEFAIPLVAEPSVFDSLEKAIRDRGLTGFERIRTTRRLLEEGEKQHNCVFSRRKEVRKDRAAIFHWDCSGRPYTIQIERGADRTFHVSEVRGKCNQPITPEDLKLLYTSLHGLCKVGNTL